MQSSRGAFEHGDDNRQHGINPSDRRSAVDRLAGEDDERLPTLREAELQLVQRALRITGGNKLRAARMLGVSRKWLYARLDHDLG